MAKVKASDSPITTPTEEQMTKTGVPVTTAHLQAAVIIPAGGGTESMLSTTRPKGLKMEWLKGDGLLIEYKGKKALVPTTNVKVVWF